MKYRFVVVALGILVTTSGTLGVQNQTKKEIRNEMIWFDTAIRLGMPKTAALKSLDGNYRTIQVTGNADTWLIESKDNPQDVVGSLDFSNDRVIRVSRMWASGDEDGFGVVRVIHSAIKHLNDEGYSTCNVSSATTSTPDNENKSVLIKCGAKSLRISLFDVIAGKAKGKYFGIDEVLE